MNFMDNIIDIQQEQKRSKNVTPALISTHSEQLPGIVTLWNLLER